MFKKFEKVFIASSIEPTGALFLDITRGVTVPQMLAALTTTSTAPQNSSLE